jgi:hypothetical protein
MSYYLRVSLPPATYLRGRGERNFVSVCPTCGSTSLFISQVRAWERPMKLFTAARPQRCGACRWRGWMLIGAQAVTPAIPIEMVRPGDLDLTAIDLALASSPALKQPSW